MAGDSKTDPIHSSDKLEKNSSVIKKEDPNSDKKVYVSIIQSEKMERFKKYKRDGNSIKDYYDNWDKVDCDEELIDVDSKIVMNTIF